MEAGRGVCEDGRMEAGRGVCEDGRWRQGEECVRMGGRMQACALTCSLF